MMEETEPGLEGGAAARPRPTPAQLAWQRAEVGLVYHYDLHVFDGVGYRQADNRSLRFASPDIFRPQQLDTDQWIAAAVDAGARFAILTASHENGFRLWQSDANPYSLKAVSWRGGKGDIVGDFVASCRRQGIEPGLYFGARWNGQLGVLDFRVTAASPISQADYNALIEAECEELATRYGPLFEVWFDGGIATPAAGGPDVLPIWERHQPHCLFYHSDQRRDVRWGGSESGTVPYPCWATFPDAATASDIGGRSSFELLGSGDPDGRDWCPAMSDAPLRGHGGHDWFWEPGGQGLIYSVDALMDIYERSVGHNSTLILGVTPDDRGLLPAADVRRLREWGGTVRQRYGAPLAATGATGDRPLILEPGKDLILELTPAQRVGRVVLQEDIRYGEVVRRYVLEAQLDGAWRHVGQGACIGHKRIHPLDPGLITGALRLRIEAAAPARLRSFAAYGSPAA